VVWFWCGQVGRGQFWFGEFWYGKASMVMEGRIEAIFTCVHSSYIGVSARCSIRPANQESAARPKGSDDVIGDGFPECGLHVPEDLDHVPQERQAKGRSKGCTGVAMVGMVSGSGGPDYY
jgi:hypothetical protein